MSTHAHRISHTNRRTNRSTVIALGVAALFGLAGLAPAQQPPVAPGPPTFADMDQNGDGQVSAAEFGQLRAQRMTARATEGRLMRNAANAPTFESLDTNGNGTLSPAEVTAHQQAFGAGGGPGRGPCGPGPGPGPGPGMTGAPCQPTQ
jgi:hypothetical protein